jgi:Notch-like protein
VDGINSFSCECSEGFTGRLCDVLVDSLNDCLSNPCGLNGQCVDGSTNYTCICSPGYSGPQCTQGI